MRLIIVGSGRCVWDDLEQLLPIECDVMAVNDAIMHYPYKLTHAYSIDNSMLNEWVAARRPWHKKLDGLVRKHCMFKCPNAERQILKVHANSGINAIHRGLDLGYTEIIVCGVPVDNSGHYFDPPWIETNYDKEKDHLHYCHAPEFEGKVYFMSGRASGKKPAWL